MADVDNVEAIKAAVHRLTHENVALKEECASLTIQLTEARAVLAEIGGNDVQQARRKAQEYEIKCQQLILTYERLVRVVERKQSELLVLDDDLLLETFALYKPKFALSSSAEYKERLDKIRGNQRALIRQGEAVRAKEEWTVKGSAEKGTKMVADIKKLMLRSFNNECDYCVDHVSFSNVEKSEERITKSFAALNELGKTFSAEIATRYKELKMDELRLAHEYQCKKQDERDEQRREREQAKEQQKVDQELREVREKIEKEQRHFGEAISQEEKRLAACDSSKARLDVEEKLFELRQKLAELESEEKLVEYREKNAKAGYVYIISNIGAFGAGVYKIGMTRRYDPQERVAELGDASVPFAFDLHAKIFSEDAPALEAKLHEHFERGRINKLNWRKEFYRADIREIEAVIRSNYDKVFDLVYEPPAEQYRTSLRLSKARS